MTATPAPVVIRAPAPPDRAAGGPLWQGDLAFYDTTLPAARHDRPFAARLSPDPTAFRGLVAERDGRLLGLAHSLFHPHGWQDAATCYLQDLRTVPAARGQGIARALIAGVRAAARARGATPVYGMTHATSTTARALYDRVARATGFVACEVAP